MLKYERARGWEVRVLHSRNRCRGGGKVGNPNSWSTLEWRGVLMDYRMKKKELQSRHFGSK